MDGLLHLALQGMFQNMYIEIIKINAIPYAPKQIVKFDNNGVDVQFRRERTLHSVFIVI